MKRDLKFVTAWALAFVLLELLEVSAAAADAPRGPRIMNFQTSVRVLDGRPGLKITCTLKPDENTTSGRAITRDDVKVSFNSRTLRRSLYSLDAETGEFSLNLNAKALQVLEATHPTESGHGVPAGQQFNRLDLELTTPDGRAHIERPMRPLATLTGLFLGVDAPAVVKPVACMPGRYGAPGQETMSFGLRREQDLVLHTPDSIAQAQLVSATGEGLAAWVLQGETSHFVPLIGLNFLEDEVFADSVEGLPGIQAVRFLPQRAYAASMDGPSGRSDGLLIQSHAPDRRLELPTFGGRVNAVVADSLHAIVLRPSGRLEAYTWAGQLAWKQEAWPQLARGGPSFAATEIKAMTDGGVLFASTGSGTVDDVEVSFLAVRRLAADGRVVSSSVLLDPFPGAFSAVEDVRVAELSGRVFAVVSASQTTGYDLITRVYDMAATSGLPLLEIDSVGSRASRWTWGAETMGDRLVVGLGPGGVTLLAPVERSRP